jgi:hypothetical protein
LIQKNLIFSSCKFFSPIFGHINPGYGSVGIQPKMLGTVSNEYGSETLALGTYVSGDEAWLGGHSVTVPHGKEEREVGVTQAEQPVTKASETMRTVTSSIGNNRIHHRKKP